MRYVFAALGLALAAPLAAQTAPPRPRASRYCRRGTTRTGLFQGHLLVSRAVRTRPGCDPAARRNAAARNPAVDVFYVHPTTSKSREVWNQDLADAAENRWADESVVARQASVFTGCCRVFSPRYRAATAKAFTSPAGRDAAFELAFSDIERAFDWYLAHENHGRPFIIAGHSQGAFHMATLLERRIDGTRLQRQMVAAYIIGINLAEGDFGRRFKPVKPCARPR